MSDRSSIEWTDATWNPVRGCTRVSPGCGGPGKAGGCYAEAMAARFSKPGQWGHGFAEMRNGTPRWTGHVALIHDKLDQPLRWKEPRRIFANSTSDLFHEALDIADIAQCWAYMTSAYWHEFQVLTKRADRMAEILSSPSFREMVGDFLHEIDDVAGEIGLYDPLARLTTDWRANCPEPEDEWPISHIWCGVSAEDQPRADERIPLLLETPAAVRFVSLEPLLGRINLGALRLGTERPWDALAGRRAEPGNEDISTPGLDWVIVGGESGPHARPMECRWALFLRDQCRAAGIPFFFKQWGEWIADDGYPGEKHRVGKKAAGRLLDGVEHNAMPVRA